MTPGDGPFGFPGRRHQGPQDTSPAGRIRDERALGRSVDRVVAQCQDEVRELIQLGVPARQLAVVPSGVNVTAFAPLGPAESTSGRPRVLSVGRLVERKGFQDLVRAMALVPPGRREEMRSLMDRISQAVGGFFRGQLLVALFVGVASSIGLWAIGLPFWLLVGMVAGVFNLVPLVGPFIGGGLAVVIALISGQPLKAVWAALVLLAVQQIDNHLISPNVMSRTVQLHPVVVMLALLAGASFAGLFGMLVVVPLVAVAKIVFLFVWSKYVDYGDELVRGGLE